MKSKWKGTQYSSNRTPVTISKKIPPTRKIRLSRSSACARLRAGGHVNSRGITDHCLTITAGISASPSDTWIPWLTAYSHDGCVGQANR